MQNSWQIFCKRKMTLPNIHMARNIHCLQHSLIFQFADLNPSANTLESLVNPSRHVKRLILPDFRLENSESESSQGHSARNLTEPNFKWRISGWILFTAPTIPCCALCSTPCGMKAQQIINDIYCLASNQI